MPRGDGTGPMGMGQMSGRAGGSCAGNETPGYANAALRRGSGMGRGRGRGLAGRGGGGFGWRHWFYATGLPGMARFGAAMFQKSDPNAEKQALRCQADDLQSELDLIKKRLDEMESETAK